MKARIYNEKFTLQSEQNIHAYLHRGQISKLFTFSVLISQSFLKYPTNNAFGSNYRKNPSLRSNQKVDITASTFDEINYVSVIALAILPRHLSRLCEVDI
jgi:hypothetical protein